MKYSRENFNFSQEFQDLVLACILRRAEFMRYSTIIDAKYFNGVISTLTARVWGHLRDICL